MFRALSILIAVIAIPAALGLEPAAALSEDFESYLAGTALPAGWTYEYQIIQHKTPETESHAVTTGSDGNVYRIQLETIREWTSIGARSVANLLSPTMSTDMQSFSLDIYGSGFQGAGGEPHAGAAVGYSIIYHTANGTKAVSVRTHALNDKSVDFSIAYNGTNLRPDATLNDFGGASGSLKTVSNNAKGLYEDNGLGDYDADVTGWILALGGSSYTSQINGRANGWTGQYDNVLVTSVLPDTTPPTLTAPAGFVFEANGPLSHIDNATLGSASATDDRDPAPLVNGYAFALSAKGGTPTFIQNSSSFPLGTAVVTWVAVDSAGNAAADTQVIVIRDTTPPAITVPSGASFNATGNLTKLTVADYGSAFATDTVDPAPAVTSDAPSFFPVGNTTITWTATDASGNSANATQVVTATDTTPPVVTPPADVSANATGILTAVPSLGMASATDAADGSPVITNDAPGMFPIGNTTVTWNATDSSGNWATAAQLVTVSGNGLDSDWHYVLRWHEGYWGHAAITFAKHFDSLTIEPGDVGQGDAHLFKTFRTDDIRNHNITIKSDASSQQNVTIYVLDGAYSKDVASDFTLSGGPALKGGGILTSYALADLPESFEPDWTRSQLEESTLVISLEKKIPIKNFKIHSVEFEGHSKWTFEDYKVEQRGNKGTYLLLPTRPSVYGLPVNDTFAGSLDGWTYWGYTSDYTLGQDNTTGRPSPSAFINMDQFDVFSGMSKIVDISGMPDGQNLTLSYDYRASSAASSGTVTNSFLRVFDADTGNRLFQATPAYGGTRDTGWRSYSTDLTDETSGSDRIEIVLGFHDSWVASWNQTNWYDNVSVYTGSPSGSPSGAASGQAGGASGGSGAAPAAANMTGGAADPGNWFERLP